MHSSIRPDLPNRALRWPGFLNRHFWILLLRPLSRKLLWTFLRICPGILHLKNGRFFWWIFFWSLFPTKRSTKTRTKIRKIRGTVVLQLFWPKNFVVFARFLALPAKVWQVNDHWKGKNWPWTNPKLNFSEVAESEMPGLLKSRPKGPNIEKIQDRPPRLKVHFPLFSLDFLVFSSRGSPCFYFASFLFFSRHFRGSVGIRNPCVFGGVFPAL